MISYHNMNTLSFTAGCLAPLAAGAAVIMPSEGRFAASTFWRDAVFHQATFYTAVPTMHQILLQRSGTDYPRATPPPLRFIRSCSSPLAPAVLAALEAAFNVPVLEVSYFWRCPKSPCCRICAVHKFVVDV